MAALPYYCPQQWANVLPGEALFRPLGIPPRWQTSVPQTRFNNFEPRWGEGEGLVLFLSRRLLLGGIFQRLPMKTTGRVVSDKLQRPPLKSTLEVVSVLVSFI